ncbi:FAD/NAD(P)-binding domain-containing protein [Athelia psychrophila]|uniref:FAD/NAD(P)-binding domain-containing protein n=1 Tax=Athelia psychrophila TaxID=1759441 RepID=A0A166SV46_9AGAM|nr:FAD/NAD(P)-binding domain-containing protein [Fibularhizoctonia sp. CBS 109695]
MYARTHGKTPFVIYQGSWNVMDRDFERDIIPMARAEGMALAPWNVLAAGKFRTDAEEEVRRKSGEKGRNGWAPTWERNETERKISTALEKIAKEVGTEHISAVAIAYVMHKAPYVFPVVGGRKIEHLLGNIEALDISLSAEQIAYLESILPFEPGFPHNMIGDGTQNHKFFDTDGTIDRVPILQAITPAQRNDSQPTLVNAKAIAERWLKDFSDAVVSGDPHALVSKTFLPNGWLRDVLIFTWDSRSLHGHDKITAYLQKTLPSARITKIVLDETPGLIPSFFPSPFGQGVELSFRFETPIAFGRGLARLVAEEPFATMRALSVFVVMDDLKGHEEAGCDNGLFGGHTITWNEVMDERRARIENDPEVLIIGGGQSGVHVAARFKQMNIPTLVVEKNQRIGDNWRKRYPTLSLHTPKTYSSLLYQPYPHNYPLFVPRDKVADSLEHYAVVQELICWTNSQALPGAQYDPESKRWMIQVERNGTKVTLRPFHIVLATGAHGSPYIPTIPNSAKFRGETLHTSQFLGGQKFAGMRVVVLGAGNSSADICQDLSFRGAASVTMVQRSKTCVISARKSKLDFEIGYPADRPVEISDFKRAATPIGLVRQMSIATADQAIAADKDMLDGLQKAGLKLYRGDDNSGVGILYFSRGGGYWIDVGCADLIASGKVAVKQGTEPTSFTETGLLFSDRSELEVDAVIYATGYSSWRDHMKKIFGNEVIDSTKEMWGLDEEDEIRGAYRPTGHPALWYAAGDFADSRFASKQMALHIKAALLNLKKPQ